MASNKEASFPSKEEWEHHKEEIIRLYIVKAVKLSDVRSHMERKHNFKAKYALADRPQNAVGGTQADCAVTACTKLGSKAGVP